MTTEDGWCPCDSPMYATGDCPIHDTHDCDYNACVEPATYYHDEIAGDDEIYYSCEKHKCSDCVETT